MKKINQHIEIAHTENMNINTMGLRSCQMIQAALTLIYKNVGISRVNDADELKALVAKNPDLVFLGLKRLPQTNGFGDNGINDSWITDYLDKIGVNYTGSSRKALELGVYKNEAKLLIRNAGLPTAEFFKALPSQYKHEYDLPLPLPLFVKPNSSGGSKGIDDNSVVRSIKQFNNKVESIFDRFGTSSLIEEYLTGREFSVAILDDYQNGLQAMPIEIIANTNPRGDRILSSCIKKADTEKVVPIEDLAIHQIVSNLAKQVFVALGARDFGRIDIRMDELGKPYFLEANLIPGLSGGYFTRACKLNKQINYTEMIQCIAKLGLSRSVSKEYIKTKPLPAKIPLVGMNIELEPTPT